MLLLPRCLNNLAEFVRLRLHVLFFAPYFLHFVLFLRYVFDTKKSF